MTRSSAGSDALAAPNSLERIVELDALRGLAVIGIAWMNVYAFALPIQAYYNPAAYGLETGVDRWVWLASFVFVEDKFRTLFAMLFGAGCLILLEKDNARPIRAHVARMVVLFAIGLAHSIVLASNDVLRAYAMAGLALPFLRNLAPQALYAIAVGLVVGHVGLGMVSFGPALTDFYQNEPTTDAVLFAERNFGRDAGALQYALGLGQESLVDRVARRSVSIPAQLAVLTTSLPLNLAAMIIGMGLWRQGMFAGQWRTFVLQRSAAVGALFALPALLVIAWWCSDAGFPGSVVGAAALVISAPFDTALGLAYAFLFIALAHSQRSWTKRLAAVGRLSLTNYVMTSAVFGLLFAPWGLGWFAKVSRAEAFALSFVPILVMLVWSSAWLNTLGQGPLEWLWRRSARILS